MPYAISALTIIAAFVLVMTHEPDVLTALLVFLAFLVVFVQGVAIGVKSVRRARNRVT